MTTFIRMAEQGERVRPDMLKKGNLIFIQHHGEEPELGVFLLNTQGRVLFHSFSDPDNRIYDYYFADGAMPVLFRVNPVTYTNPQIEAYRKSDIFKYLGEPTSIRSLRPGQQYYFEEASRGSSHDFVLGKLIQMSMTQVGNYSLVYERRDKTKQQKNGSYNEKPKIYDYKGPKLRVGPPGNLLGSGGKPTRNRIIAALGPETGTELIIKSVPGAAMTRRLPLMLAYNKVRANAKREAEAWLMSHENFNAPSAAPEGGGGGGAAVPNNNTTNGGRRRPQRKLKSRRRKTRK